MDVIEKTIDAEALEEYFLPSKAKKITNDKNSFVITGIKLFCNEDAEFIESLNYSYRLSRSGDAMTLLISKTK